MTDCRCRMNTNFQLKIIILIIKFNNYNRVAWLDVINFKFVSTYHGLTHKLYCRLLFSFPHTPN